MGFEFLFNPCFHAVGYPFYNPSSEHEKYNTDGKQYDQRYISQKKESLVHECIPYRKELKCVYACNGKREII